MRNSHGLQKKMILKKELLLLLSEYTTFVSSTEIAYQLGLDSTQQAQLLCRELAEDVAEFYQPSEFELNINKNGVMLIRKNGDLQRLLTHYHSEEPSFNLLLALFFNRVIQLADYCGKYYVSESTVRRRVRQTNKGLKDFNLKITCSHELKLVGQEQDILKFIVLSAYLAFQKMSNTFVSEEKKQKILNQTKKIVTPLFDEHVKIEFDTIALIYSILSVNIQNDIHLEKDWQPFSQIEGDFLPEKPVFLTDWTKQDWEFFLTTLYLYNLYLPPKLKEHLPACCQEMKDDWSRGFSAYFPTKIGGRKAYVEQELQRLFLFCDWYPKNNYILELFPIVSLKELAERYPLHLERFELLWSDFNQTYPAYQTDYFKLNSLLLTLYLTPLDERKEKISIYLETIPNRPLTEDVKIAIYEYFWIKYQISFTEQIETADLYVTTIKQLVPNPNRFVIPIHPLILNSDLQLIEQNIQRVLKERKTQLKNAANY